MSLVVPGRGYTTGLNGIAPLGVDRKGFAPPGGLGVSGALRGLDGMPDADLEASLAALKPDFLDQMIERLDPKPKQPSAPTQRADMVRPDEQRAWKWDGGQVRYLTEDEQAAQDKADQLRARLSAQRMQQTINARRRSHGQRRAF